MQANPDPKEENVQILAYTTPDDSYLENTGLHTGHRTVGCICKVYVQFINKPSGFNPFTARVEASSSYMSETCSY